MYNHLNVVPPPPTIGPPVSYGNIFQQTQGICAGDSYILAQVKSGVYQFIGLDTGNRHDDSEYLPGVTLARLAEDGWERLPAGTTITLTIKK